MGRLAAISAATALIGCACTSSAAGDQAESDAPLTKRPFMQPVEPARSGQAAWFGLRPPGPATDPVQGVFDTSDTELPARPATFGPGPVNPLLSGEAVYADLAQIVDFSHESREDGEYLWGRVTGRPAFDRTLDWVAGELREAGLDDARLEKFEAKNVHLPVSGEVRLIGSDALGVGSKDIVLQSAMVGGNGPVNGALTAPLIYVGQGTAADLTGRALDGKIAVLISTPSPSLYAALPARRIGAVLEAGAAGVIEIQAQAGNMKSFDRDRHGCGKGLCFTVGGEDGYFLQNVLGEAARQGSTVFAALTATSETLDPTLANVVATIPGKTDRVVIINAHADAWFGGADDNGSGLAVMLSLARYFQSQPQLDRTLVFIASAGHHSSTVNGLRAFRAKHEDGLIAKTDLILNIEHPAQTQMMRSYLYRPDNNFGSAIIAASGDLPKQVAINNRSPFLIDLWHQGVECFGLDVQRIVDEALPGDLNAFSDRPDIAQTQMIASGGVYHTTGDDLYAIPPAALERAARFHAFFIGRVANAPVEQLRGGDFEPSSQCPPTP